MFITLFLLPCIHAATLKEFGPSVTDTATQTKITDTMNSIRQKAANGQMGVMAQGANINELVYDTTIQTYADTWSKQCIYNFNPAGQYYDLVMMMSYTNCATYSSISVATVNYASLFNYWVNDAAQVTTALIDSYADDWTKYYYEYSASVWATTKSMACGVAICIDSTSNYPNGVMLNCYFSTEVNVAGQSVYKRGTPASQCGTAGASTKFTGLCAPSGGNTQTTPPTTITPPTSSDLTGDTIITVPDAVTLTTATRTLIEAGMTGNRRNLILTKHNQLRQTLATGAQTGQPKAANLPEMTYSVANEPIAIKWAKSCPSGHNPNRGGLGENMYWSFSSVQQSVVNGNINAAATAWYNEVTSWDPAQVPNFQNQGINGKVVGHYTQVVWANSKLLSCGTSVCKDSSSTFASYPFVYTVACNYGGPGNYIGQAVYQTTTTAGSACAAQSTAYPGLCAP